MAHKQQDKCTCTNGWRFDLHENFPHGMGVGPIPFSLQKKYYEPGCTWERPITLHVWSRTWECLVALHPIPLFTFISHDFCFHGCVFWAVSVALPFSPFKWNYLSSFFHEDLHLARAQVYAALFLALVLLQSKSPHHHVIFTQMLPFFWPVLLCLAIRLLTFFLLSLPVW